MRVIRCGILGAARINDVALIKPAAKRNDFVVQAVAARDKQRAQQYANKFAIPVVADDYQALIEHPDVDVIYNPLPASLHHPWTIAALRAGKPVLCEKPFALNAPQAEQIVSVAKQQGLVVMEAMHYRFHPLMTRILQLMADNTVGNITRLEAVFTVPIKNQMDIRYQPSLGGGALMDLGCYTLHWLRTVMAVEPVVIQAQAQLSDSGVDLAMSADLMFNNHIPAQIHCSMAQDTSLVTRLIIHGDAGSIEVTNPLAPQWGHRLRVTNAAGDVNDEQVEGETTYDHQLAAFIGLLKGVQAVPVDGLDSINNMLLIDAVYRAAGMGEGLNPSYNGQ